MCRAFFAAALATIALLGSFSLSMAADPVTTRIGRVTVGDVKVFYREAGDPKKPALLLLHGFPSLIAHVPQFDPAAGGPLSRHRPRLSGVWFLRCAGPDTCSKYTFEHLAEVMDGFTRTVGLKRYAMYIFDYGAPIDCGWRWRIGSASPPSSRRTATPTKRA